MVGGEVLNALRHQRLGHDYRRAAGPSDLGVLNALRHQRLGHQGIEVDEYLRPVGA